MNAIIRSGSSTTAALVAKPDRTCQFCGKVFLFPRDLGIHMRSHTGERPYPCPHCPYRATQTNNLKRHIMASHNPKEINSPAIRR